jgi:hypothetical protein
VGADTESADSEVNDRSATDECLSITVDSSGYVYCAGDTNGDLAEAGNGYDAFVLKANSSLSDVLWIRQLGNTSTSGDNSGNEFCFGVAVDANGNVYCGGQTSGSLVEANAGGTDAFILKLDSSGSIQWTSQFGNVTKVDSNSGNEYCYGIAVHSTGFPTCAGYSDGNMKESGAGNGDVMLLRLKNDGSF